MIDRDKESEVIKKRATNLSIAKIATEVGLSKQKVVDIIKEHQEEIATLEAMKLEELYEETKISTTERIRNLSSLMERMRTELEGRNLTEVPTEKLLDMYLKTASTLEAAIITPNFKSSQEINEARTERAALEQLG